METLKAIRDRDKSASLLVRYWGLGKPLSLEEKDALLAALDEENKVMRGPIHERGLQQLAAKGLK